MEERTFPCTTGGMEDSKAFLETVCAEPKPSIMLDEVVSNIVRCSRATDFKIGLDRTDDGLKVVFTDDGVAFDPTREIAEPDVNAPLAERKIGGLGMFMVKKLAKSVNYERRDGRNVLTVVM